jgi:hypothetical protein
MVKKGTGGLFGVGGWIAFRGKKSKMGYREMCKMAKIDATINPLTLKSRSLWAASMAKRMRLFSGAKGM